MKFFFHQIIFYSDVTRKRVNEGRNVVWVKFDRKFCNASESCFLTLPITLKESNIIEKKIYHFESASVVDPFELFSLSLTS